METCAAMCDLPGWQCLWATVMITVGTVVAGLGVTFGLVWLDEFLAKVLGYDKADTWR